MQVGQRLLIREPRGLRHEAFNELQHAIGSIDEAFENLVRHRQRPSALAALIEPSLGAGPLLRPAAKTECQVVGALEVRAVLLELGFALGIDQRRDWIRKLALRIGLRRVTAALRQTSPNRSRADAAHC